MPIPRLRDYSGPALFSYGFRPFFFFRGVLRRRDHPGLAACVLRAARSCHGVYAARLARS